MSHLASVSDPQIANQAVGAGPIDALVLPLLPFLNSTPQRAPDTCANSLFCSFWAAADKDPSDCAVMSIGTCELFWPVAPPRSPGPPSRVTGVSVRCGFGLSLPAAGSEVNGGMLTTCRSLG